MEQGACYAVDHLPAEIISVEISPNTPNAVGNFALFVNFPLRFPYRVL
ncbi:hypothetical protein SAMN04488056_104157 [Cohaesibacter marisflavi]|uniref:Uncharacterized protein n=1 Tax=Cohaesibacter marisflavi TaxID=655353 RepID=A0A1I5FQ43_9HYPH|nr:hypothetical protein SAMN04488056_104157 [Cohaesibacter marisflavi]